jgi:hypothetical protein
MQFPCISYSFMLCYLSINLNRQLRPEADMFHLRFAIKESEVIPFYFDKIYTVLFYDLTSLPINGRVYFTNQVTHADLNFFLEDPIYLQSVIIHSANGGKVLRMAFRRVLISTPL